MSVYTSTNALDYKAGYPSSRRSPKRSSIQENTKKIDALLSPDALDIHNRSGKAIMNSPPLKIASQSLLRANVVRHYVASEENKIWAYLFRPGGFFFMWVFIGLLAMLA